MSGVPAEATLLAFDYGEKRIGVAVGNMLMRQARALTILPNTSREARFAGVAKLLEEWVPGALVVGLPMHPDGTPHAMTQQAKRFGNQLAGRFNLPVTWVDERYSTVAAALERDSGSLSGSGGVNGSSNTRKFGKGRRGSSGSDGSAGDAALDADAARIILQQFFDEAVRIDEAS